MTEYGPEFYFDGMGIGLFLEAEGPTAPGLHRYAPFRGSGHYEMHALLRAGGSPRCDFEADGERVTFTVQGSPEYGVLDLCDIERTPLGTS